MSPAEQDEVEAWRFRVQPSFWLAASSGRLRAGSDSDMRKLNRLNLDNPSAAFYLDADLRRDDLRFSLEGFYFRDEGRTRLGSDARMFDMTIPAGRRLDTAFEVWSLSGGAWYRFFDHKAKSRREEGPSKRFDMYLGGGVRLLGTAASIDISDGPSGNERDIYTQGFLGTRAELVVSENFTFTAQAGLGAALPNRRFSSLHLMSSAEWHFRDNAALSFGYQHLDADARGGDVRWSGRIAGLYAGFVFEF